MSVQTRIATSVFCAFSVFICGLFTISLALGVYVFYASDIGGGINYEYPINSVIGMYDGEPISAIDGVTIGHIFAIMWALTVGMFVISIKGSKIGYFHALEKMRDGIKAHTIYNHMFQATRWFSILILVSVVIVVIQGLLGVEVVPPEIKNDLVGFYQISNAPYIEEVMFRILLIGIPLYLIYSHKASGSHFLKSLWHPDVHLHIERKTFLIIWICITGILFGAAHVLVGEPWSAGKVAQATAAGVILGWAYYRYGIVVAILVHIMVNYMLFALMYSIVAISGATIKEVQDSQFLGTIEILMVVSGIVAVVVLFLQTWQRGHTDDESVNHYNL